MSDKLYTIAEMAKILNIPESTARFYRDRYSEYIQYTGEGRKKRYLPETLEALRIIAEMSSKSINAEAIAEQLSIHFTRFVEAEQETAVTTAGEQQQYNSNQALTAILNIMDTQRREIEHLREQVEMLANKQEGSTATVTAIQQQLSEMQGKQAEAESHNKELDLKLLELRKRMEQKQENKRRGFFNRIFNKE